jgi:uncharacterized membrane protein HdeD (DUF308 family)
MAQSTQMQDPTLAEELAPFRSNWGWIVALGVIYLIAGVVALGSVVVATVISVYLVGLMMIVAGVTEVVGSFLFKSWGRFLLWLLIGILYIVAGVAAFQNPQLAAALLTLILGVSLLFSGLIKIVMAFAVNQERSWIWVALSGVITAILGGIILARWPVSSLYILGVFLGVNLIFSGAAWLGFGLSLRRARS